MITARIRFILWTIILIGFAPATLILVFIGFMIGEQGKDGLLGECWHDYITLRRRGWPAKTS
jgi:hypothetical protein